MDNRLIRKRKQTVMVHQLSNCCYQPETFHITKKGDKKEKAKDKVHHARGNFESSIQLFFPLKVYTMMGVKWLKSIYSSNSLQCWWNQTSGWIFLQEMETQDINDEYLFGQNFKDKKAVSGAMLWLYLSLERNYSDIGKHWGCFTRICRSQELYFHH